MNIFKKNFFALLITTLLVAGPAPAEAAHGLSSSAARAVFSSIASSASLANPSMILIDQATGEIVYERDATSPRRPASVLKLLSATAALEYLDPNFRYVTKVLLSKSPGTILLSGTFDPWMTTDYKGAQRDHRVWINYLANKALSKLQEESISEVKEFKIEYSGLYPADVLAMRKYLAKKGVRTSSLSLTPQQVATLAQEEIVTAVSPSISDMLKFALTWSDNLLAERLARAAARAAGFGMNDAGVSETFYEVLRKLNVDSTGIAIHDGSGLSKSDRVTAALIADLLVKVRSDEKFLPLYEGLPVSGISGTLKLRFKKSGAPAFGLIHAKTGTLDGTVSLAGYITSGEHEYVFVVIADQIPKGYSAATRARNAMDKMLGRIASL